jgi:hypothetical protein
MEFHPLSLSPFVSSSSSPSPDPTWLPHPHSLKSPRRVSSSLLHLSPSEVSNFDETGCLVMKSSQLWNADELKLLVNSVNMMDSWEEKAGKWMKYYETSLNELESDRNLLQRIENFTQYNPGLDYFMNGSKLLGICSDLFSSPAILYKEKINYKFPHSSGFAPHQDVAAGWWKYNQSLHISCLICIDPSTRANGCLEVVFGAHKNGMLSDPWKELPFDVVQNLKFTPLELQVGDTVFFDSFVPHRSAPNTTNSARRALYATYAMASEGDFRERYYADKRQSFPPDIERLPGQKYEYKI